METATLSPVTPAVMPTAKIRIRRDHWGALMIERTDGANRTKLGRAVAYIRDVMAELEAGDVDEHRAPAWTTGCEFDRKGRGEAINVDVYGVDLVDGQPLAVVQVRQFRRGRRFGSVRKNYFLVGRNEGTRQPFAHPIESRVVHAAIRRDESPSSTVTAARAWIFDVAIDRLGDVIRHGDVALVPVKRPPAGERTRDVDAPSGARVIDSHVLMAEEMATINGRLYARNPHLQHLKGQHEDVSGDGWYRVQIGVRADTWSFAAPTAD